MVQSSRAVRQRVWAITPLQYRFFLLQEDKAVLDCPALLEGNPDGLVSAGDHGAVILASKNSDYCEVRAEVWQVEPPTEAGTPGSREEARIELTGATLLVGSPMGESAGAIRLPQAGPWWLRVHRFEAETGDEFAESFLLHSGQRRHSAPPQRPAQGTCKWHEGGRGIETCDACNQAERTHSPPCGWSRFSAQTFEC